VSAVDGQVLKIGRHYEAGNIDMCDLGDPQKGFALRCSGAARCPSAKGSDC
jgi:hypothetical protein